jgi:hypothetical protein
MKWLFVFYLFTSFAWALDPSEEFPVKVEKIYGPEFIELNRGREDGLKKGDHIKIFKDGNYVSRAIVMKTEMTKSYLRVYRVIETLKQGDSQLELFCINRSEIPEYVSQNLINDEVALNFRLKK